MNKLHLQYMIQLCRCLIHAKLNPLISFVRKSVCSPHWQIVAIHSARLIGRQCRAGCAVLYTYSNHLGVIWCIRQRQRRVQDSVQTLFCWPVLGLRRLITRHRQQDYCFELVCTQHVTWIYKYIVICTRFEIVQTHDNIVCRNSRQNITYIWDSVLLWLSMVSSEGYLIPDLHGIFKLQSERAAHSKSYWSGGTESDAGSC